MRDQYPVVFHADEMKRVDKYAISSLNLASYQLMTTAGAASANFLQDFFPDLGTRFLVVCGPGNNGGDGMITARILHQARRPVSCFLVGDDQKLSLDANRAWLELQASGVKCQIALPSEADIRASDVVVDAIFGIGFRGPLTGRAAEVVATINSSGKDVVSLDIPTGLTADSNVEPALYLHATRTITFGALKISQVLEPSRSLMGRLTVADIGLPAEAIASVSHPTCLLSATAIPIQRLSRKSSTHKGNFGHVAIVGGCQGMYGAPILAAQGAMRAGAGLVTLFLPVGGKVLLPAIPPEIMARPVWADSGMFVADHISEIASYIRERRVTTLVIGMGIGLDTRTGDFVENLLKSCGLPTVVDADGLTSIKRLGTRLDHIVVTPHAKEYRDKLGAAKMLAEFESPVRQLRDHAIKTGLTIVHKSATTLIAEAGGQTFINTSGNPGMAKGGTGDVLAGIIGALLAQGLSPSDAAQVGVFLHGAAGDLCARTRGELGVLASEIADAVPIVARDIGHLNTP